MAVPMRKRDREIGSAGEIDEIMERAAVCRVALCDGETPYIVTMNFGYRRAERPVLFFHCAGQGRKLDILERNDRACFTCCIDQELVTADRPCSFGMKYRSVVGVGRIERVLDAEEKRDALACIMMHYVSGHEFFFDAKELENTTVLRLEVAEMTGKRAP
jgi:nitroimidazol reductase NimA-like FMN-containing flavoprotein (pyridoxamine 5'-phosphate oxidase superfamily)